MTFVLRVNCNEKGVIVYREKVVSQVILFLWLDFANTMTNESRIVKNILHAGQKYIPIANGSKVSNKKMNKTRFWFMI